MDMSEIFDIIKERCIDEKAAAISALEVYTALLKNTKNTETCAHCCEEAGGGKVFLEEYEYLFCPYCGRKL